MVLINKILKNKTSYQITILKNKIINIKRHLENMKKIIILNNQTKID